VCVAVATSCHGNRAVALNSIRLDMKGFPNIGILCQQPSFTLALQCKVLGTARPIWTEVYTREEGTTDLFLHFINTEVESTRSIQRKSSQCWDI
jgi:hypothetical protein